MPSIQPYTLHFKGGLHLGTRGINLGEASEFIPSDTLFAALLDVWNRLGNSVDDFVKPYRHSDELPPPNPPFLLTSAFPFAGDVRFYPIPVDLARIFSDNVLGDTELRKPLRKLRYFSEGLLRKMLAEGTLDDDRFPIKENDDRKKGISLQKGTLWLLPEEVKNLPEHLQRKEKNYGALHHLSIWKQGEVPRVTIDRIAQTSTLYHAGRVTFAQGCGLWFGVHWRKDDDFYKNALQESLQALQYDGIGGERSSGYGAFDLKEEKEITPQLPDAKIGDAGYLLSRYHPTKDELPAALQNESAAYKLFNVGGWLHTHGEADQRRRKLWMTEAGSLVQITKDIQGSLEDVQPNYENKAGDLSHPVWRYGFALPIGGLREVK